jgi:hypothetical protein
MLRKFFVAFCAMSAFLVSSSQIVSVTADTTVAKNAGDEQEKTPPLLIITGSADVYYKYDFAKTKANTFTSFTNSHNSFAPGMASVKFEHKGEKVGAVLDLGFGQRAKEFSYTDEGITQAIKQLYLSYSPAEWLKFTAGTWATHVGYELLDPQLNRNYSMSYMFTNGPFSHTGLKADVTKGKHGFMIGVSNPTDFRTPPDGYINKKFLLAQYSFSPTDKIKLYLNYVGGKAPDTSKTNQFDAVVTAKINDKFNLGYNGTINNIQSWDGTKNTEGHSWWGSALYINYDPVNWFGLTLREEYFSDKNHLKLVMAPEGCKMFASTLSANFKVSSFILIPEFRFDKASEKMFVNKNSDAVTSATSFLIAAVYSF